MPTVSGQTRSAGIPVHAVLLAACAGSADVLAFFGLGGAFASIVTGNVVVAGYGIAVGSAALVKPTITAVAGFIAGALAWTWLLRRRSAALPLLLTEMAILLAVLAAWLSAGGRPAGALTLALLAAVSIAMGGQSIWALRIHQTTTYFTGMVTKAVSAASDGQNGPVRTGIRQLAALLIGAILSGLVLSHLRPAAPAVPVVLLAAATVAHVVVSRTAAPGESAEQRHNGPG